jgi:hypothetical protein
MLSSLGVMIFYARSPHRHCEERSDEAIHQQTRCVQVDYFATLAMTAGEPV